MNYDHAFHAGNHADVLKHLVLRTLLDSLKRKPAPFFVLDTHAGQGMYHLKDARANRTGEADSGVLRLIQSCAPNIRLAPALQAYLDAVQPYLAETRYPGSPQLIADALRADDRLACCELQPDVAQQLKTHLRRDQRVAVHVRNGYEAISALLPPLQKRGLVLIDPPYEAQLAEFDHALAALRTGLSRWSQGIFALWYPIKRRRDLQPFLRKAAALPAKSVFLVELLVRPDDSPLRLNGSGMLILNPPWQLDTELGAALPDLANGLAGNDGQWRMEWLRAERSRRAGEHHRSNPDTRLRY